MEFMHHILDLIVQGGILFFEVVGVLVLLIAGVKGVVEYIRRDVDMRLNLARGMATALSFKLGGEILRTVVVQDFREIAIVGCIVLLRAAITFLIHWEINHMEQDKKYPDQ